MGRGLLTQHLMLSPNLSKTKLVVMLGEWGGGVLTQLLKLSQNLPKTQSWWVGDWVFDQTADVNPSNFWI